MSSNHEGITAELPPSSLKLNSSSGETFGPSPLPSDLPDSLGPSSPAPTGLVDRRRTRAYAVAEEAGAGARAAANLDAPLAFSDPDTPTSGDTPATHPVTPTGIPTNRHYLPASEEAAYSSAPSVSPTPVAAPRAASATEASSPAPETSPTPAAHGPTDALRSRLVGRSRPDMLPPRPKRWRNE